jgi:hypothetical protein
VIGRGEGTRTTARLAWSSSSVCGGGWCSEVGEVPRLAVNVPEGDVDCQPQTRPLGLITWVSFPGAGGT